MAGTGRISNLTRGIVQELGLAIVTGVYTPENPFPTEAALCKQFGVSRSVLREAVKMLTAKGLLSARPRQGTWVVPESQWNILDPDILRWMLDRKFSLDLLREFTQVRLAVEPDAAALAARRSRPEDVAALNQAIERMRAAERGDDDPLESDIAFHVAILNASGNRFFAQLKDFIATALRISIRLSNQFKGVQLASVEDHNRIVTAIAAGDDAAARAAASRLVQEVIDLIDAATAGRQPASRKRAL